MAWTSLERHNILRYLLPSSASHRGQLFNLRQHGELHDSVVKARSGSSSASLRYRIGGDGSRDERTGEAYRGLGADILRSPNRLR